MATRAEIIDRAGSGYDADYVAWIEQQIDLLRSGEISRIDAANIAEELGDLGASFYRALVSAIAQVLLHLAKWDAQPSRRSRSWTNSVAIHRRHAEEELDRSPSLRRRLDDAVIKAWFEARRNASSEMDLPLKTFAAICPYSWDDIMNRPIEWPEDHGSQ